MSNFKLLESIDRNLLTGSSQSVSLNLGLVDGERLVSVSNYRADALAASFSYYPIISGNNDGTPSSSAVDIPYWLMSTDVSDLGFCRVTGVTAANDLVVQDYVLAGQTPVQIDSPLLKAVISLSMSTPALGTVYLNTSSANTAGVPTDSDNNSAIIEPGHSAADNYYISAAPSESVVLDKLDVYHEVAGVVEFAVISNDSVGTGQQVVGHLFAPTGKTSFDLSSLPALSNFSGSSFTVRVGALDPSTAATPQITSVLTARVIS